MKWQSNQYTQALLHEYKYLIPKDFDFQTYISFYPDLISAEIDSEQKAMEHYLFFGHNENRIYKKDHLVLPIKADFINGSIPEIWNNKNKNLLYFSPNAPDFDMSGGGNRLLQILTILKKKFKYNVWFLCNGYLKKHHIDAVKQLDIPIFLADAKNDVYLDQYLKEAIQQNIIFNNAIFSWYDMGRQYIDIVKSYYPDIKIIVDSVDVHWLREERGRQLGAYPIKSDLLTTKKTMEKSVYVSANVVLAVTENDKREIHKELGYGINVKILSSIHKNYSIKIGTDILFVGNYQHQPNIQCVQNCIKIYKQFIGTPTYKQLKIKPKLLLVGSGLPENIIKEIDGNDSIVYLGQVNDLRKVYSKSSLLIAPITWGAGIKCKICDAAMCGLPILTSDIGNEGINLIDQESGLIANTNKEFVKKLINFFEFNHRQKISLGKKGKEQVKKIASITAAEDCLKHCLEDKHILLSIVTYNQPKKLQQCLDSIINKTKYINYTIFITDNSSDQQTKKLIKKYQKQYPKLIQYKKNKTNQYFIQPNNWLFKNKKYQNSDIVLINDDVIIVNDYWLNYMYSSAYISQNIGAVGGKTIFPNGVLAEAGAELYNNGFGNNKGRYSNPNNDEYNIPKYTGYCSGCLLYMKRDTINKIGIFSTKLKKMYYEDAEWQYRSHIFGYRTLYEPRCIAIHAEGSSSGTDTSKGMKKYQEINRKIFLKLMQNIDIEKYNNEQ
jgi:GT2 family glycosyltransferase/glycosyltransferase involved in cell wall biosynthesis